MGVKWPLTQKTQRKKEKETENVSPCIWINQMFHFFFNMRMELAPFYLNTGASFKKKKKCLASFCACQICFSFSSQAGIQNDTHQNITHELCIHAYRDCRNERNGEIKEPTDANTVLLKAHTGSRVPRHNGNVTAGGSSHSKSQQW